MQVQDQELEKGRRNDDSSSRESSPYPRNRRSLTPASDDDTTIPPIADDDTPPPQDRPLIRQAVAFASAFNTTSSINTINTYEASSSQQPAKAFLPGQVPTTKPARPKKKVKHSNDAFASQTNRWRAQPHDFAPSNAPPTYAGDGPYNSLFRAQPQQSTFPGQNVANSVMSMPDVAKAPPKKPRAPRAPRKATKRATAGPSSATPPATSAMVSQSRPDPSPSASSHTASSSSTTGTFSPSVQTQTSPPTHPTEPQAPSASTSASGGPSSHASSSLVENEIQKRARPLPVLTVLITDERGPYPDYLLAEVRVPLKHAERQEDGWWADAKDVCEKLQSSPSRIDGPAKVYTLRGKFRQFFLKVSADNKDEWQSANLVVSSQRTLDVFIESPYPPGHYRPSPSREYADSSATNRQGFTSPHQSHHVEQDSRRATTSSHASPDGHRQHKRRRSPSFDNYSVAASPAPRSPRSRSTLSPSYRESPRESNFGPPQRHRPYPPNPHPLDLRRDISDDDSDDDDVPPPPPRGFHTPGPDADEDEVHEMVSKSISPLLEDDPSWPDFFRWKAMPQTAAMVLKQYQWVKQKMDEWNGKPAPLRSRRFSIEDTHVLAALQLNDKWGQSCKETLSLLELYGPEGTRLQDSTAKAILEDNSPPTYNAKPIKRLLHRLQEVHADYLKERPLVAQSNDEETDTMPDQH